METRRAGGIAFLALAAALLCCGRSDKPVNLIILGVDTLRPDHLGCYGYGRATSPSIDKLAAAGALFENTVSQSSWTLPSFTSLMTSLYPHQHGALHGITEIGSGFPTLAGLLAENGYATGALVNAAVLSPETKFNRGFTYYDLPTATARLADGTTQDALKWIDQNRGKPFFLFLHYYDPHMPYAPPVPYDTLFDGSWAGRVGRSFDIRDYHPDAQAIRFEDTATPEEWRHIEALYDGEIAFTDRAIGDLLDGLAKRRLRDRTLIVLVGDHGEEFYEHGNYGHGHCLFGEVINVPLVFALADAIPEGLRIGGQVRVIDVMPTVLDLLGIESASHFEGVSLVPLLTGQGSVAAGTDCLFPSTLAYSEGILHGPPKASVTARPWKLILDLTTGREAFFNLGDDPDEMENLVTKKPDPYRALSTALVNAQLGASDTWYLEMAGGNEPHTFDVEVSAVKEQMWGNIFLHKLMDGSGGFVPEDQPPGGKASPSELHLRGIKPRDPLTLAFKVDAPPAVPLTFDLRIDGRRAAQRTFIGEPLTSPREMPFSRRTGQTSYKGLSAPRQRPEPPYFLLWRVAGRQASQTPATLSPEAQRELRALGYIQ
jgi:arylsulfatase A-like enzyme